MKELKNKVVLGLALLASLGAMPGCLTSPPESAAPVGRATAPARPVEPPRSMAPVSASTGPAGPAMQALKKAALANRHLLVFMYARDDEATRAGRTKFDVEAAKLAGQADRVVLDRAAGADAELVARYSLRTAPTPLILMFAPNGAVTGGFRAADVTAEKLTKMLASPAKQRCLSALQERKLVLLCVQNATTPSAGEARVGAEAFKADARFGDSTELVTVDPADASERDFLAELKVPEEPSRARTVFLAPPGVMLGVFEGATTASTFEMALAKATSGGCGSGSSGCGPGSAGCGPASAGCGK